MSNAGPHQHGADNQKYIDIIKPEGFEYLRFICLIDGVVYKVIPLKGDNESQS